MDSSNPLPQVFESENAVDLINALIDALSVSAVFGRDADNCEDLTWAWFGGRLFSDLYSSGTVTVAASSTVYVTKRKDDTSSPAASTSNANWLNTSDYYRLHKLTTNASAVTAWEDHRLGWFFGSNGDGTGSGGTGSGGVPAELQCIPIACGDETTPITAGAAKVTFRMPYALKNVTVKASLTTSQASGSIFTVDINEGGASILSTKLTIDNTEDTSATAAAPAVVSDAILAADAKITVDVDQIGDGTATGLKVYVIGELV